MVSHHFELWPKNQHEVWNDVCFKYFTCLKDFSCVISTQESQNIFFFLPLNHLTRLSCSHSCTKLYKRKVPLWPTTGVKGVLPLLLSHGSVQCVHCSKYSVKNALGYLTNCNLLGQQPFTEFLVSHILHTLSFDSCR